MTSRRFHVNKKDLSDDSENEESYEEPPRRSKNKKKVDSDNSEDSYDDSRDKRKTSRNGNKGSNRGGRAWEDGDDDDDDDDDDNPRTSARNSRRTETSRQDNWAKKPSNRQSSNAWEVEPPPRNARNNDKGTYQKSGWSSAKPAPRVEPPKTIRKPREYVEEDADQIDDDDEDEEDEVINRRKGSNRSTERNETSKSSSRAIPVPMPSKPKNAAPDIQTGQKWLTKDRDGGGRGGRNERPSSSSSRRKPQDDEFDELDDDDDDDDGRGGAGDDYDDRDGRKSRDRTGNSRFSSSTALQSTGGSNSSRPGTAHSRTSGMSGTMRSRDSRASHETRDELDMDDLDGDDVDEDRMDATRGSRDGTGNGSNQGGIPSYVLIAHDCGDETDHVQCVIVRERGSISSKMTPTYRLYLENKNKLLILAVKSQFNRTSNYHLYDMTRGQAGKQLSKKSGNYLGKLRAKNVNRTDYALITQASEREEMAAVVFDRHGIVDQIKEGSLPRKMSVMVPQLGLDGIPVSNRTGENGSGSMVDMLRRHDDGNMFVFESKEPVFENGNFRLNFRGRVSVPSVKNFQLVSADEIDHVICQFGKIGEDRYHLDYKTPLNAFQAFALALCQFNL